jgi:hypothetical protein
MWDDNEWQYHQDSRDAAVSDGALALAGIIFAVVVALVLGAILY